MANNIVRAGDRWARMTCLEVFDKELRFEYPGGGYDPYWEKAYKLKCDCGSEIEILRKDFTGKRVWKDCGQCGLAMRDGKPVPMTITLPYSVHEEIDAYARLHTRGNVSHAVLDVLRLGFKVVEEIKSNGDK